MSTLSQKEALADSFAYCWQILPLVSRTFALTIPVLNEPLRTQVGVSYLLCRIADTIEDTVGLSPENRSSLFSTFQNLIHDSADPELRERFRSGWLSEPDEHHKSLLDHTGTVLDCYASLPFSARNPIADCVDEMVKGMAEYPSPGARSEPIEVCSDLPELERYCHFVAGTVGVLLSRLFAQELGPAWFTPERPLQGQRFGLGLQLTNIIKDQGTDRGRGVTYIPGQWIETSGGIARLSREGAAILIDRALEHLDAAQVYMLTVPAERADMRLFCLWAAHLALATLRIAANGNLAGGGAKVDREELWKILELARENAADDRALQDIHDNYRDAVRSALAL
jgi:farnesyl-diphosphate farnesyltransferase